MCLQFKNSADLNPKSGAITGSNSTASAHSIAIADFTARAVN